MQRKWRFLPALATAFTAALMGVAPAAASAAWCEDDPAITITAPDGNSTTVYLTTRAQGLDNLPAIQHETISTSVLTTGDGQGVHVMMTVSIPGSNRFAVRYIVSTGPNGTGSVFLARPGSSRDSGELNFQVVLPEAYASTDDR